MSLRFGLNAATALLAGFVVVASMAFRAGVAGWIGFGVSTGILLLAGVGLAFERGVASRIAEAAIGILALWSLSAALIFSGKAETWLVFADAVALVGAAFAQLVAHEVVTRRALAARTASGPQSVVAPAGTPQPVTAVNGGPSRLTTAA